MITGELKSKVDKAWNSCWTGGLVVPTSVVEQLTYLLFIKLLDEREDINLKNINALKLLFKNDTEKLNNLKKNLIFPEGEYTLPDGRSIAYADMRWQNFCNFNPEKMYMVVKDFVFPFILSLNDDIENDDKTKKVTAYSKFMKNAIFMIPTPRVLDDVVKQFSDLKLSDKDMVGDVYEYILGKMAASGTNGQFRTPRHIINMMVELMEPKITDTICDPAMGTAGFLVSCAEYIEKHMAEKLMNKEHQAHFNSTMFNGFDMDQTMLRLGAMNMVLHGVKEPNIDYKDSLSKDNTDINKYDLIMANPPFKGTMYFEGVADDLLNITRAKKTELLFLALFVRSLNIGGRCCAIVPDGVLFGSSNAHMQIRKEIIEHQQLDAVISMPSGVFKPYAGVSTAIIIFTKTNNGGTKNVWFYDMKSDGYSLDDKRTPISENDIPDIIERYKNRKNEEHSRLDKCFLVPVEEIIEKGYDLSINKYKETIKEVKEYRSPSALLEEIENLEEEFNNSIQELKRMLGDL